jgi:glycosyltransferase involved in cell wall biosynthesis
MGYTVLSVAYPFTPVGEDAVGGSEQVLTLLDRALTEAGHRSIVIAAEGSSVQGTLITSPRVSGKLDYSIRQWGQQIHKRLLHNALARYSVDLVHMHSLDFHRYLPEPGTPTLATLHLPPDWYPDSIFRLKRPQFYLNCVSSSQQKACPKSPLLLHSIPNGVDVDRLGGRSTRQKYVLALGRICPEKGFHFALEAAKRAHVDLLLAGEITPYQEHHEYFRKRIRPRLDGHRQFLGPVGFNRKKRLLSQARCLLITSTVAETSSLVAMEALAAGTPVIAFPSGALPEIVEHGRTGFIVSDAKEMAQAIRAVDKLDPEECKLTARRRFCSRRMVEQYMQAYRGILSKNAIEREDHVPTGPDVSWLVNW